MQERANYLTNTWEAYDYKHDCRECVFTVAYEPPKPACAVDFSDLPEIITNEDTPAEAFVNTWRANSAGTSGPETGLFSSKG